MPLTLAVDGEAWRAHIRSYADSHPGLVPVIKGNGYGFGAERLAAEADELGVAMVAVSDPEEVAAVRAGFGGEILVMAPWLAHLAGPGVTDARVLRTVGHLEALRALAGRDDPIVVEGVTSMRRHGIEADDLAEAAPLLRGLRLRGLALHLPIDRPRDARPLREVMEWIQRFRAADVPVEQLWVSHLRPAELTELRELIPDVAVRPRIGTALWHGTTRMFRARATVLDVRSLPRGTPYGYRQRTLRRAATLLVISGGTAQGVSLEAAGAPSGIKRRGQTVVLSALEAAGLSLSPFIIGGRKRWFAEAPHMQVSMVLLPSDVDPPKIGDEVDLDVRMTTTHFDAVRGL